jgi:hypothetical protein
MSRRAVFFLLLVSVPVLADDEKPLDLAKVVSQDCDRKKEERTYSKQNHTDDEISKFDQKQAKGRADLVGKKVEGTGEFRSVNLRVTRTCTLYLQFLKHKPPLEGEVKAIAADPRASIVLLKGLERGTIVKVQGTLWVVEPRKLENASTLTLKDSTFSLP